MARQQTFNVQSDADVDPIIDQVIAEVIATCMQVDLGEVLEKDGSDELEKIHGEYFANQAGPAGKWDQLHPKTVYLKGHGKILVEWNALQESLSGKHSGPAPAPPTRRRRGKIPGDLRVRKVTDSGNKAELEFGTSHPWSDLNDRGGTVPNPRNPQHPTKIPPRPHVGLDDRGCDRLTERIADAIHDEIVRLNQ